MKYLRILGLAALLSLSAVSCTDTGHVEDAAELEVSPLSLTFTSDVSTQSIDVIANGKWYLDASEMWCQTSVTSGNGDGSVKVTVSENTSGASRTADITFSSPGVEDKVVKVTQNAVVTETMEVTPDAWDGKKRADLTYQLLIYSFADSDGDGMGDFQGIRSKLDYLDKLGVSAVWLSPAHPADSYHGYDVTDYNAVNPDYGTEKDFKALVDDAHSHGIKIYMDYVLNHTGKSHPWFKSAISDPASPYRDYYFINSTGGDNYYSINSSTVSGIFKFSLDWSNASAPTVTVTKAEKADPANNTAGKDDKYLWFGDDGVNRRFYNKGNGIYELTVDFKSDWGFLIRTSTTSWDNGTKYGAPSKTDRITFGETFTLDNKTAADIAFQGTETQYYYGVFGSWMPDINYGPAASVAGNAAFKDLVASAEKWIDLGVDGFRLDAVKHIYDRESDNPVFLKTWYTTLNDYFKTVNTTGEDLYMVGECFTEAADVAPYYAGLPAMFEFSFWNRLNWAINNSTGCYFVKDILSYHDMYDKYSKDWHEATKLSNHDEDRAGSTLNASTAMMKIAGAVLLTAGGEPYVYYGEELGYVGKKDGGDEYVRSAMKWGDSCTTTFIKQVYTGMGNVKTVKEQAGDEESILNVYRSFGQLRNTYPALATGKMTKHPVYNEDNTQYKQIAAWYMTEGSQKMLVLHNLSSKQTTVNLSDGIEKAVAALGEVSAISSNATTSVVLPAWSSVVFLLK